METAPCWTINGIIDRKMKTRVLMSRDNSLEQFFEGIQDWQDLITYALCLMACVLIIRWMGNKFKDIDWWW